MGDPPSPTDPRAGGRESDEPIVVSVLAEQSGPDVDVERWRRLGRAVLVDEGIVGPAELNLFFVDEEAMTDLNRSFMGEDGPTDVLAFPIDGGDGTKLSRTTEGPPPVTGQGTSPAVGPPAVLGDIVICPGAAARNAAEQNVEIVDELALLVVHGILHVLGHDHREPEETARMRDREDQLLDRFHRGDR